MQIFDFTVLANRTTEINANGRYVYYYSGSAGGADTTITLREDTTGTGIILLPGQAFRIPDEQKTASRWMVGNYANAATIKGRLVVGSGSLDDNRVMGSVEIINGGKSRTLAGGAYSGHLYVPANAACYSTVQLWNPPGSGLNVIIDQIQASITGYSLQIGIKNAIITGAVQVSQLGNKRAGGAVPSAIAYQSNTSGVPDLGAGQVAFGITSLINLSCPYVITPGYGLVGMAPLVNTGAGFDLEFFEELV